MLHFSSFRYKMDQPRPSCLLELEQVGLPSMRKQIVDPSPPPIVFQIDVRQHQEQMRSMYDLIVVGAGPAGASAARTAAQHGLKTLLIEKDQVPRNKLCGGGATPKASEKIEFKVPDELIECETKATRIHVGGTKHQIETDRIIA